MLQSIAADARSLDSAVRHPASRGDEAACMLASSAPTCWIDWSRASSSTTGLEETIDRPTTTRVSPSRDFAILVNSTMSVPVLPTTDVECAATRRAMICSSSSLRWRSSTLTPTRALPCARATFTGYLTSLHPAIGTPRGNRAEFILRECPKGVARLVPLLVGRSCYASCSHELEDSR